jgi:hypothetical protein
VNRDDRTKKERKKGEKHFQQAGSQRQDVDEKNELLIYPIIDRQRQLFHGEMSRSQFRDRNGDFEIRNSRDGSVHDSLGWTVGC